MLIDTWRRSIIKIVNKIKAHTEIGQLVASRIETWQHLIPLGIEYLPLRFLINIKDSLASHTDGDCPCRGKHLDIGLRLQLTPHSFKRGSGEIEIDMIVRICQFHRLKGPNSWQSALHGR